MGTVRCFHRAGAPFSTWRTARDVRGLEMSFQCVASSDDNPGEMVHAYDQGVEAFAARSSLTFGDPRDHFLQALDTPSQCFLATVAVGLTSFFQPQSLPLAPARAPVLQKCLQDTRMCVQQSGDQLLERERWHAYAFHAVCRGELVLSSRIWETVALHYPGDLLAIRCLHEVYRALGDLSNLKQHVARVLPYWDGSTVGYSHVLGMHAFGLAEAGQFNEAEEAAMRSLQVETTTLTALHAACKCFLGASRPREGLRFLRELEEQWGQADDVPRAISWWKAHFYLDQGDTDRVVHQLDVNFGSPEAREGRPLVGEDFAAATELLWALQLRGEEVKDRAEFVQEGWEAFAGQAGLGSLHGEIIKLMTGKEVSKDVQEALEADLLPPDQVSWSPTFTHEIDTAHTTECALAALRAHHAGDHAECVAALLPVRRYLPALFGLESADVMEQTLLASAELDPRLGRALYAQRSFERPHSPYVWIAYSRVLRLAGEMQAAEAAASYAQTLGFNQRGFGAH
jgi:hypothetical protein